MIHTSLAAQSVAATATATVTASGLRQARSQHSRRRSQHPGLPEGPHQYRGDDECLVGQCLRDVDVKAGGIHGQGVIGVPDPDLAASREKKVRTES